MQDEQVRAWQRRYGRKTQHSVLGRVKNRLARHTSQVVTLSRWEPTTQLCPICGKKTRIPLKQRTYQCAYCGYKAPRDVKAAQTMVWMGQSEYSDRIQACGERIGVIRGQSAHVLHALGEAGNRDGFSLTVVHPFFDLRPPAAVGMERPEASPGSVLMSSGVSAR